MTACGPGPDANAETVLFEQSILPVLEARCASCHMTGDEPGNMALVADAAYPSLLQMSEQIEGMQIVEPGNPDQSYLMLKLKGKHLDAGGMGARMPLAAPPLTPEQIKQLRDWIEQGAAKN